MARAGTAPQHRTRVVFQARAVGSTLILTGIVGDLRRDVVGPLQQRKVLHRNLCICFCVCHLLVVGLPHGLRKACVTSSTPRISANALKRGPVPRARGGYTAVVPPPRGRSRHQPMVLSPKRYPPALPAPLSCMGVDRCAFFTVTNRWDLLVDGFCDLIRQRLNLQQRFDESDDVLSREVLAAPPRKFRLLKRGVDLFLVLWRLPCPLADRVSNFHRQRFVRSDPQIFRVFSKRLVDSRHPAVSLQNEVVAFRGMKVRACMRACVRACVRAWMKVRACVDEGACVRG